MIYKSILEPNERPAEQKTNLILSYFTLQNIDYSHIYTHLKDSSGIPSTLRLLCIIKIFHPWYMGITFFRENGPVRYEEKNLIWLNSLIIKKEKLCYIGMGIFFLFENIVTKKILCSVHLKYDRYIHLFTFYLNK